MAIDPMYLDDFSSYKPPFGICWPAMVTGNGDHFKDMSEQVL
jgi:hypothetical protein